MTQVCKIVDRFQQERLLLRNIIDPLRAGYLSTLNSSGMDTIQFIFFIELSLFIVHQINAVI